MFLLRVELARRHPGHQIAISLADDRDLESAALVGFGAGPAGHRLPEVTTYRTTKTGTGLLARTSDVWLPSTSFLKPLRPCDAMTIKSFYSIKTTGAGMGLTIYKPSSHPMEEASV